MSDSSRSRRQFLKEASALSALPFANTVLGCDAGSAPRTSSATDTSADITADAPHVDTNPELPELPELPEYEHSGPRGPENLFQHGVASGDPWPHAVILWTRISASPDEESPEVWWEISLDDTFQQRVQVGTVSTHAERDFTVKVDANDLQPATTYWYRFLSQGRSSAIGRTRTAPVEGVEQLRFAVTSCSNFSAGYFHGYRHLAAHDDLDVVLHLGDYIYENGSQGFTPERAHQPPYTLRSLDDYRSRYAQYRQDSDLAEAHRQHPFIVVWDDHESANNAWSTGAPGIDATGGRSWTERKAAAIQAHAEWLPIRESTDGHIYREFEFGGLAHLLMLDTRLEGRSVQVDPEDLSGLADPERSLLGWEQEAWLDARLTSSSARWRLIGQQVMLAPLMAAGTVLNSDQWDGYPHARQRLFERLASAEVQDVVVLTGDIHSSWANDLPLDPASYEPETGAGSVGIELVTPGITSGFPLDPALVGLAKQLNPHIQYGEVSSKGYLLLDIQSDRVEATWMYLSSVQDTDATEMPAHQVSTQWGSRRIQRS